MEKSIVKSSVMFFLRMLVTQVFCIILYYTMVLDFDKAIFPFIFSIVICLIFYSVCYSGMNDTGRKEQNNFKNNSKYARGAFISAIGAAPFAVLNIVCALDFLDKGGKAGFLNLCNPEFYFINKSDWYIKNPLLIFLAALALPVGMIIIGAAGYIMGRKNKSLLREIIYKKEPDKN